MRTCIFAKPMEVYGHNRSTLQNSPPQSKSVIYKPTTEALLMLKGILCDMISKHKKGFSWGGNFDTDDVDVFNGRIFLIRKSPNKFTDLAELIKAMEEDFRQYTKLFLSELIAFVSNGDRDIPYLGSFNDILSKMEEFAKYWLDEKTAERFRELLINHPFLKPSIIRSYLLSGIYTACRAHDLSDSDATFKSTLKLAGGTVSWIRQIKTLANTVCTAVLCFDPRTDHGKKENDKDKRSGQVVEDDKADEIFSENLESFVEYMRHTFHHGPDHSKEKRKQIVDSDGNFYDPENKPRKQYMQSLEESETGAAVAVAEVVWDLLLLLVVKANCISGM